MPSPDHVWHACVDRLSEHIPKHQVDTWFDPVQPVSLDEKSEAAKLRLRLPSSFYCDWLQTHYSSLLHDVVEDVIGRPSKVLFEVGPTGGEQDEAPRRRRRRRAPSRQPAVPASSTPVPAAAPTEVSEEAIPFPVSDSGLNQHYTFDGFIQGDCNELAYSAARAISDDPVHSTYNPLLVYGGVGLGKTHLVQAIGNKVAGEDKLDYVRYVSGETFTSQFVQAIKNNNVASFSTFYRNIDLLIVDDVQFFGGKEKTQEEFFHVFNELYQQGKQIVLCADRAPREIPGIEDRLLSRFQWGLSADMKAPDLETRTAILQHKAECRDMQLPPAVVAFLAEQVTSNVRTLEGALNRLAAHARLKKSEIDVPTAREVLHDIVDEQPARRLKVDEIQEVVSELYDIPLDLMLGRSRKQEIVTSRQVAMYLCKQLTNHTLKEIGLRFGGRDHSTVIHACRAVQNRCETEAEYRGQVERAEQRLRRS